MSGFKVNFHKSLLVGITIPHHWLEEATQVLNYKLGSSTFTYLSLPIGANPRRNDMWQPVIDTVRSRMLRWKVRLLWIKGRVVIIKSVLSALSIYLLSFFKVPLGVLSKLESLFKQFLWVGRMNSERLIGLNGFRYAGL
ncbi:unnamed protein product [Lathyrus sativus]|nr:unnamed protein product [Lathyrus sativus]